jgi:leucyl aminopeptidase
MKLTNLSVLALSASLIHARYIELHEKSNAEAQVVLNADNADPELFLVELAPGKTQWVTEEEKWELRRVRHRGLHMETC